MNLVSGERPSGYLIILLFGLSSTLLLLGNNSLILYSLDEVRNAQCAREMWQHNDPIVPTFNGELRIQKPPLHYAFMALAYSVVGESPFAARFFSGLMGGLLIVITFYWAWTRFNPTVAWVAAGGLLGSAHFHLLFRMAVPDPYLIVLLTSSTFCLYSGRVRNHRLFIYAGYVLAGLACLAKGPVAVWLIGFTAVLYELLQIGLLKPKTFLREIMKWRPIEGVFITLVVSAPWFVLVHQATGGVWTHYFFFQQNLERFSSPMEGHGGGPLVTLLYLIIGTLPLSILFPQAIPFWIKQRTNQDICILITASLAVIITFTIASTRLITYTAPAYPYLAILFALFIFNQLRSGWNKWLVLNFSIWSIIFLLLIFGAYFGLNQEPLAKHASPFAVLLVLLPISTIIFLIIYRKNGIKAVSLWLFFFVITCIAGFSVLYPKIYERNPVSISIPLINESENVYGFGRVNPAFVFPLNQTIAEERNLDILWSQLLSSNSAVVITSTEYLGELECLPKGSLQEILRAKYIFEKPTAVLFKWKRPDSLEKVRNWPSLYNWAHLESAILIDKPGPLFYKRNKNISK